MLSMVATQNLKVVVAPCFEPMDTAVGRQCQSVAINTFNDRDVVAVSMASITILGIICILVIYTLIAVLVGYHCGFSNC